MRWKRSSGGGGSGCSCPDGSEDERVSREVPGKLDEDGETGHLVLDSLAAFCRVLGNVRDLQDPHGIRGFYGERWKWVKQNLRILLLFQNEIVEMIARGRWFRASCFVLRTSFQAHDSRNEARSTKHDTKLAPQPCAAGPARFTCRRYSRTSSSSTSITFGPSSQPSGASVIVPLMIRTRLCQYRLRSSVSLFR